MKEKKREENAITRITQLISSFLLKERHPFKKKLTELEYLGKE